MISRPFGLSSWILHILYFILCTASILILMALTVERYVAVSSPVKYKTMVTSKRAILTSLLIWLAALGFSFAYFQLGFIFYSFIFANTAVLSTFGVQYPNSWIGERSHSVLFMYFAPTICQSLTVLFFLCFFVFFFFQKNRCEVSILCFWIFISKTQAAVQERHLLTGQQAGMWNVVKITQLTWS